MGRRTNDFEIPVLSNEIEKKCQIALNSIEIVRRHKWHSVITKHKNIWDEWYRNHRYVDDLAKNGENQWEWHPYESPVFWEQVTNKTMPKLYTYLNAIILAIEASGYTVSDDFYAIFGEDKVKFGAFETRVRIPHEPVGYEKTWIREHPNQSYGGPSMRKYDYQRNGELNFYIHRTERCFYKRPVIVSELEFASPQEFISEVIKELFFAIPSVHAERMQREESERQYREKEEARRRREELIRVEKKKVSELTQMVSDFVVARNIRLFLDVLETKSELSDEERNWIEWARNKADWIDPILKKEDPILGKYESRQ